MALAHNEGDVEEETELTSNLTIQLPGMWSLVHQVQGVPAHPVGVGSAQTPGSTPDSDSSQNLATAQEGKCAPALVWLL
jgi:hypothetical protein